MLNNPENEALRLNANNLLGALCWLDEMQCRAFDIEAMAGNAPRINIDPPPAAARRWMKPAMCHRITINGQRSTTFVTRVHGVSVYWVERTAVADAAAVEVAS